MQTQNPIRLLAKVALCTVVMCALASPLGAAPTYRNLAKYQTAVGSSWGWSLRPDLFATDGIVSNFHRWRSTNASGQWLEIHYPRQVTIASAHLYTGVIGATTAENWANFKLQYYNGSSWVDVPGGGKSSNTLLEVNVIFSQAVTSDKFRLLSTDAGSAVRSIREIAMFGPNVVNSVEQGYPIGTEVMLNLAHKLPATASSISGTNYAIKAVDGFVDDSSRWLCNSGVAGEWLEIDLLSLEANGDRLPAIGSAHLYSGDFATSSGALSAFTLQYWDGTSWTDIPGATITGNTSSARVIDFSSSVVTNKVRLVNNTTGSAKVAELLLFPPRSGGYALGQNVLLDAPPSAKAEDFSDATRHLRVSSAGLKLGLVGGNAVFTNDTAGADALEWQLLLNHRDGSYRIRNVKDGKCLALANISTASNNLVIGETYTGMPHQCWFLDFVNATQFRLLNAYSGLALQSLGGSTTPGTALAVVTPGSSTLQQWDTVWQAHFPKKGIAGTGNDFPNFPDETYMSYYYGKFQHTSWGYSWGRSDTFPFMGANHTFNPMQWGNHNWAHSGTTPPLEGERVYMQSQGKPFSFLGFNEPDGAEQANMTVAQAITRWPRLQSIDAPLVAPCPANPFYNASKNLDWNLDFYAAVDQLGYRVDYTPYHWYANPNSNNLISKIKDLYNLYGRPIWLTEFSSVRWSGNATWTHADNYNFMAEFLWRAENLPELARYSHFNWKREPLSPIDPVEAPRGNAFDENDNLTPYGELYASWDGVAQILPQKAYHLHNHGFYERMQSPASGNTFGFVPPNDSTAGTQWFLTAGTTSNTFRIQTTRDGRRLVRSSGNPAAMGAVNQIDTTTEWRLTPVVSGADHDGWYYFDHTLTNQRLKNNGDGTCSMVATTDTSNAAKWRFVVPLVPEMQAVTESVSVLANQSALIDVLANDGGRYRSPTIQSIGTPTSGTAVLEDGKIRYTPPNGFSGNAQFTYTITDGTVTDSTNVTLNVVINEIPVFVADPFTAADATELTAYSTTIAGSATDADGDPLVYTKLTGPDWLNVATDGVLTGIPAFGGAGMDSWVIRVADPDGFSATATLTIRVRAWSGPITLVGGSVRNGNFNANPGTAVNFQSTSFWYNTKGSQTTEATKNDDTYDGSQNATIHANRGFGVDTGHIIEAGDSFNYSYVWKDAWQWLDASGEVTVALFVTSDNTITGTRTNLDVEGSGIRQINDTYESVLRPNVYTATEADAGKVLFAAIETSSPSGFARVDNFELIVVIPTYYSRWASGNFANELIENDINDNPDGDNLTNLQEFAFGTDPTSPVSGSLVYQPDGNVTTAGSPILQNFAATGQPAEYHAVFPRRKDYAAAGLTYTVQFSADLSLWTSSATTPTFRTGAGSTGEMEAVSVPFPSSVTLQAGGSASPKFFRIGVIQAP